MVVFPLPLALVIGRGLLARLHRSCVAHDIGARTIATVGVRLGYHFEHFQSPRTRSKFDHITAEEEERGPFGQKPKSLIGRAKNSVPCFLYMGALSYKRKAGRKT